MPNPTEVTRCTKEWDRILTPARRWCKLCSFRLQSTCTHLDSPLNLDTLNPYSPLPWIVGIKWKSSKWIEQSFGTSLNCRLFLFLLRYLFKESAIFSFYFLYFLLYTSFYLLPVIFDASNNCLVLFAVHLVKAERICHLTRQFQKLYFIL